MITIVQGEDKEFIIKFEKENGDAYSLQNLTAFKLLIRKTDGSILEKTLSSGAEIVDNLPVNGKIKIRIEDSESVLLKSGDNQSLECELDEGADKRIIQFPKELTVKKRII